MPDKETIERARADKRAGKSASTQAGEFVHREIEQIRKGKHGAKNARQAIAIGLSEARRAGVDVPENPNRKSSAKSSRKPKKSAAKSTRRGSAARRTSASSGTTKRKATTTRGGTAKRAAPKRATGRRTTASKRTTASRRTGATSRTRAGAALRALKKMPRRAASHLALSRQAHRVARSRTSASRSAAARKAARTRAANRAGR